MRLLFLHYDHPRNPWLGGGGARQIHAVCRQLARRHTVTVFTGAWPGAPRQQWTDGVRYVHARPAPGRALSRLTYCAKAAFAAAGARCDLLIEGISAFSPTFAGLLSRKPRIADLRLQPLEAAGKYPMIRPLAAGCLKANLRNYRNFVAVSPGLARFIRSEVGPSARVRCIPPGIRSAYLEAAPEEDPYLLYLGRIDIEHKGLDRLLDSYQILCGDHPALRLVVAGGGPDEERLRRMVRERGLSDEVRWAGWVEGREKVEVLRKALLVCMPSRREGWPQVALEAAACAKPVVGFDVPGVSDAVEGERTGLLAPEQTPECYARVLKRLIEDDVLRQRLGTAARRKARRFTWERAARAYESFCEDVLSGAGDCARSGRRTQR